MLNALEQDWMLDAAGGGDVIGFFAELGINLPRVGDNAKTACFANVGAHNREDRDPSCSVSLKTGMWKCWGCGERGNAYEAAKRLGFEDQRAAKLAKRYGLFLEIVKQEKPSLPGERQLKKWRHALRADRRLLTRLVELKGWDPYAIGRLGLGWDGERITLAIRSGHENRVCGVVRYSPKLEPKMLALAGTKRNLFPNPDIIRKHHPIFLVEGEGTAVSVWGLGLKAVGVPGAQSWRQEWAQRLYGRTVIFLPDCDQPGRELAAQIARDIPKARIVDLEPSCSDGSDIGDWIREARDHGGIDQIRRTLERLAA